MTNDAVNLEQQNTVLREGLDRVQRELHHLDRLKRKFTILAAHELRNPLAILLGYAKILEDESSGNVREYAGIVVSRAQQLKGIVDWLILLQQIDVGELTLRLSTFSIGEIIRDVVKKQQENIHLKALQVECHTEPDLCVRADRERLAVALSNLLANAVKYSPHGGQIIVHARADADNIVVSIHDNGIGIPPTEQAHIFDRFYQVGDPLTREQGGFGLGLAVAKALIELHHGGIWVESMPNEGSTFSLSLPRTYPLNANAITRQAVLALS